MSSGSPKTAGTWTDRYIPTDPLGEGGMARVWRAWDRERGAWCALKVLKPKYAEQKDARRRFLDEGRLLMQLDHRNVIHAYDLLDEDPPCLVMEVADGGSLLDWVERHGPMPPRMAVGIAIQICKGLGAAHREKVIHRDIKPHNVLVNRKGVCKVSDFGIARIPRRDGTLDVPDATTVSQTSNDAVGTLGYMAPEQRSNPKAADVRTDIYGVGAALYHLLIGGPNPYLFAADKNPEVLRDIPEALRPVMLKTVAYRPEDRYPEIRDLSLALYYIREELAEDPPNTPQLAEGLPPEPPPPEGMLPHVSGERADEGDIEVPTTLRRPGTDRPPSPRLQRPGPPSVPPVTPVPLPGTSARPGPAVGGGPSRAASPPSPPSLPPNLAAATPVTPRPDPERGALPKSLPPRSGPGRNGSAARVRSRPPVFEPAPRSEIEILRPNLVVGTRLWFVAVAMIGFAMAGVFADAWLWVQPYLRRTDWAEAEFASEVTRRRSSVEDGYRSAGADVERVRAAFDAYLAGRTRDERSLAAKALGQLLDATRPAHDKCSACGTVRGHLDVIDGARRRWCEAQQAWVAVGTSFPGNLAVWLGLSTALPEAMPCDPHEIRQRGSTSHGSG